MAISIDAVARATGANGVLSTSLSLSMSNGALAVGRWMILAIAADNTSGVDGDHSEVTSISDFRGNVWTKVVEFTNGQGGAATGVTVSLWFARIDNAYASSDTITVNFATAIVDKCAAVFVVTETSGDGLKAAAGATRADDAADPGSMSISGLASREYLFFRVNASEISNGTAMTPTAGWTVPTSFSLRSRTNSAAAVSLRVEWLISTASGATSDPTWLSADHACVLTGFYEDTPLAPASLVFEFARVRRNANLRR